MLLDMKGNGKVFSKKFQEAQARASTSANRATDEERAWTDITVKDGQKNDPDMYRLTLNPVGSRYIDQIVVDIRDKDPIKKDRSEVAQK